MAALGNNETPTSIFRRHFADIVKGVEGDLDRAANLFVTHQLISQGLYDDVTTTNTSAIQRASKLVRGVQRGIDHSQDSTKRLNDTCDVLALLNDVLLDKVIFSITGHPVNRPIIPPPHVVHVAGSLVNKGNEIKRNDVNVDDLKTTIKDVIDTHYAKITNLGEINRFALAAQLFELGLVTAPVRDDPSYDNIIKDFLSGLSYKTTPDEVSKHCEAFLKGFREIGGPFKSASNSLRDDWKKATNNLL